MTNLEVYNIINEIVSSIRQIANIESFTKKNTTHYTITVTDTLGLSNNDYVTITEPLSIIGEYKAENVTPTTFDIKLSGDYITDIGKVTFLKPYFRFGNWLEIANDLSVGAKSPKLQFQKYPLIFLHSDISISTPDDVRHIGIAEFTLYIITGSQANDSTKDRIDHVYSPILYQIEESLITAIKESKKFDFSTVKPMGIVSNDRKEYYYYGNKNENKLNDIVDAIEIKFKNMKVLKYNLCNN